MTKLDPARKNSLSPDSLQCFCKFEPKKIDLVAPDSAFNNAEPKSESTSPPPLSDINNASKVAQNASNSTSSDAQNGGKKEDSSKSAQNAIEKLTKSGALNAFLETATISRTQQLRARTKAKLRRRQQVLEH